jgi:hypothetical protein
MTKPEVMRVMAALTALYPQARAELHFSNPLKR